MVQDSAARGTKRVRPVESRSDAQPRANKKQKQKQKKKRNGGDSEQAPAWATKLLAEMGARLDALEARAAAPAAAPAVAPAVAPAAAGGPDLGGGPPTAGTNTPSADPGLEFHNFTPLEQVLGKYQAQEDALRAASEKAQLREAATAAQVELIRLRRSNTIAQYDKRAGGVWGNGNITWH